jgi:bifunctional non-homologous end joining protein LigD
VIDGEACVLRPDGTSDFNAFQERARRRRWYPGAPVVTLMAFDILVHDGRKVMDLPLTGRKALLEQLLGSVPTPRVMFVKDLPADATVFHSMALPPPEGLGLEIEGVVAKRRESVYKPGVRSNDWLKIKRPGWQEGRTWSP